MSILESTPCLRLIKRLADDSAEILKALFPDENIEDIEDGFIGLEVEDMEDVQEDVKAEEIPIIFIHW